MIPLIKTAQGLVREGKAKARQTPRPKKSSLSPKPPLKNQRRKKHGMGAASARKSEGRPLEEAKTEKTKGGKTALKQIRRRHQIKGSESERAAARFLERRGWKILHRNKKIFGVEIDILAQKKDFYMLLEVKSLKDESHLEKILSQKQKERLRQAAAFLADSLPGKFYFFLAAVTEKKEIRLYQIT